MWAHLETSVDLLNAGSDQPLPVAVKMGTVIDRYRKEYIPELSSRSARTTYNSNLNLHIEPRWENVAIADVKPMDVDKWLKHLALSPASKGRLKRILKQLIDRAAYWELIPDNRPNPIRLVKVKGATKRQEAIPTQAIDVSRLHELFRILQSTINEFQSKSGLRIDDQQIEELDRRVSALAVDTPFRVRKLYDLEQELLTLGVQRLVDAACSSDIGCLSLVCVICAALLYV